MRRGMLALMLAAVLGSGIGAPAYSAEELFDTKKASEHLTKGIDAIRAKNYDKAIAELEKAVDINPDAESFYFLGYAYYLKGKVTGDAESRRLARENFDKAYELDPQYSPTGLGLPAVPAQPRQQPAAPQAAPAEPSRRLDEDAAVEGDQERIFRGSSQPGQETTQEQYPSQPASPPPAEQQPEPPAPPPAEQQPVPPSPEPPAQQQEPQKTY